MQREIGIYIALYRHRHGIFIARLVVPYGQLALAAGIERLVDAVVIVFGYFKLAMIALLVNIVQLTQGKFPFVLGYFSETAQESGTAFGNVGKSAFKRQTGGTGLQLFKTIRPAKFGKGFLYGFFSQAVGYVHGRPAARANVGKGARELNAQLHLAHAGLPYGGLGDVRGLDDFAAHLPDFLLVVPGCVAVELNALDGGKHVSAHRPPCLGIFLQLSPY